MPYFPVDDQFAFHPKAIIAGNEAIGVWARAGAWCKAHATGGFVPADTALAIGSKRVVGKLVAAGLWDAVDGGYRFHDWEDQAGNYDAETERSRREHERERWRERKRAQRQRERDGHGVTPGGTPDGVPGGTPLTPSPSPSPKDLTKTSESSPDPAARETTDSIEMSKTEQTIAGQMGITRLQAIADEVRKHAGRRLDAAGTLAVCRHLLDKAPPSKPPRVPQRYVIGSIARSPFEVQQFIDEGGFAA